MPIVTFHYHCYHLLSSFFLVVFLAFSYGHVTTLTGSYFVMRSLAHVKQFQDAGLVHLVGVSQALLCRLQYFLDVNRWSHLQTHSSSGY